MKFKLKYSNYETLDPRRSSGVLIHDRVDDVVIFHHELSRSLAWPDESAVKDEAESGVI